VSVLKIKPLWPVIVVLKDGEVRFEMTAEGAVICASLLSCKYRESCLSPNAPRPPCLPQNENVKFVVPEVPTEDFVVRFLLDYDTTPLWNYLPLREFSEWDEVRSYVVSSLKPYVRIP
jgi:hypothetical protein